MWSSGCWSPSTSVDHQMSQQLAQSCAYFDTCRCRAVTHVPGTMSLTIPSEEGGMLEPRTYAWLIPERLAIAERPGGGGRTHRRARRDGELAWWAANGVTSIVSGMRSRHGLLEAGLAGFRICWHPLVTDDQAAREAQALVADVRAHMDRGEGAVLVHVDRAGEWQIGRASCRERV